MKLTPKEARFLTALTREQNQTGCRGPAHDLLRQHAYPNAPTSGPGSLESSYEMVPLTSPLLKDCNDLEAMDDFLRVQQTFKNPEWPWSSPDEFRARLEEARHFWQTREK